MNSVEIEIEKSNDVLLQKWKSPLAQKLQKSQSDSKSPAQFRSQTHMAPISFGLAEFQLLLGILFQILCILLLLQ